MEFASDSAVRLVSWQETQLKDFPCAPQYTIQTRDWKTGDAVAATDFSFKNTTEAKKVDLKNLQGTGDLPEHFMTGESK